VCLDRNEEPDAEDEKAPADEILHASANQLRERIKDRKETRRTISRYFPVLATRMLCTVADGEIVSTKGSR
jgi:hypothetical protein